MATVQPLTFGTLLKRHRWAAGLTQGALAEHAGYNTRQASMLERDARMPLVSAIELLATVLALASARSGAAG